MQQYHISELEELSGIRAFTIRMWERRYGLIKPARTDTNIRVYDDSQVRKLLNVSTLVAAGYRISKIAAMPEEVMHEKLLSLQYKGSEKEVVLTYVNLMVVAMLEFSERKFEHLYKEAVLRYGLRDTMLKICYPLLQKIGTMWTIGKTTPAQEHFVSVILRRKLTAAADKLVVTGKPDLLFVLMLPPGEWHEIGLLFADYLIRSSNVETVYLGQNVPYDMVSVVLAKRKVSHLLLFYISPVKGRQLHQIRQQMGLPPEVTLLVAGNPAVIDRVKNEENTVVLHSPGQLLEIL